MMTANTKRMKVGNSEIDYQPDLIPGNAKTCYLNQLSYWDWVPLKQDCVKESVYTRFDPNSAVNDFTNFTEFEFPADPMYSYDASSITLYATVIDQLSSLNP